MYPDLQKEIDTFVRRTPKSAEAHKKFAAQYHLPFTLLSDSEGEVRKLYGVPSTLVLLPGRVTYVIDKEGVIRHIFNSQFAPAKHVSEALKILETLQ